MGSQWDHIGVDAETKLVVSMVQSSSRDQRSADLLVQDVASRVVKAPALVTTDEHEVYREALLKAFGIEYRPRRRKKRGRKRNKKRRAPKGLLYATVNKSRKKGRVAEVSSRLVLGSEEALAAALGASKVSGAINTAFVERYNGTARHFNARKQRKTYSFSKQLREHLAMSWLMVTHYNFCRPHRALRVRIAERAYNRRSPAVAAGITDHIWSVEELLDLQILRGINCKPAPDPC